MRPKIILLSMTQREFSEEVFLRLGKGRRHAERLYAEWFRKGKAELNGAWYEKQAESLAEGMLSITDFSLPQPAACSGKIDTFKYILRYPDGLESESVLIPMQSGNTLCISSQVGCRMGCTFCETGRMGLLRHLKAHEIVAQVFYGRMILGKSIRNIVFMGMGEPLDNFEQVQQAIKVLCDPAGLAFGPSHITVSTSGLTDAIYRFIETMDPALNLAVSVNAPNDSIRNRIMPVNRKHNMAELKKAMQAYCEHPRRTILIEYVMLKGVNDAAEHAQELADYLQNLRVKVNLIPYNAQSDPRFLPSEPEAIDFFMRYLRGRGYQVLLRNPKGDAIMAACGQLGNKKLRLQMLAKKASNDPAPPVFMDTA